jgi:hypothetical protein
VRRARWHGTAPHGRGAHTSARHGTVQRARGRGLTRQSRLDATVQVRHAAPRRARWHSVARRTAWHCKVARATVKLGTARTRAGRRAAPSVGVGTVRCVPWHGTAGRARWVGTVRCASWRSTAPRSGHAGSAPSGALVGSAQCGTHDGTAQRDAHVGSAQCGARHGEARPHAAGMLGRHRAARSWGSAPCGTHDGTAQRGAHNRRASRGRRDGTAWQSGAKLAKLCMTDSTARWTTRHRGQHGRAPRCAAHGVRIVQRAR